MKRAMTAEPLLIPDIAHAESVPSEAVQRQWVAPTKNPSGRQLLTFAFTPRAADRRLYRDTGKRIWEVACNLIASYFENVGGFRHVDDRIVSAWCSALGTYTPEEIEAGIRAKARSLEADDGDERRYKLLLRGHPHTFPRRLDYWIECSPEGRAKAAAVERQAIAARLDDILRAAPAPIQPGTMCRAMPKPTSACGFDLSRFPESVQHALSGTEQRWAARVLEALGDARRGIVERQLRANWADYRYWFDWFDGTGDPADPLGVAAERNAQAMIRRYVLATIARDQWPEALYDRYHWDDG